MINKLSKKIIYPLLLILTVVILAIAVSLEMNALIVKGAFLIGVTIPLLVLNERCMYIFALLALLLYVTSLLSHSWDFYDFLLIEISAVAILFMKYLYGVNLNKCLVIGTLIMLSIIPVDTNLFLLIIPFRDILLFVVSAIYLSWVWSNLVKSKHQVESE